MRSFKKLCVEGGLGGRVEDLLPPTEEELGAAQPTFLHAIIVVQHKMFFYSGQVRSFKKLCVEGGLGGRVEDLLPPTEEELGAAQPTFLQAIEETRRQLQAGGTCHF